MPKHSIEPTAESRVAPLTHVRRLDLNLLLTLDALMKTRSATATGKLLHKTQPAISRDLARLRERLNDPLLVVTRGRFVPTERALELHAVVRESLEQIENALGPPTSFDPAKARGTINIGSGGHIELLLAAPLLDRLRRHAPGVTVRFQSVHGNFDSEDLDNERIDVAVGLFENIPQRFQIQHLFDDKRVCLVASTHPMAGRKRLSLNDLARMNWFAFAHMHGRETTFDRILKPLHRKMVFTAYLSGFGITPHVLLGTDYATTMPERVARLHQQHFDLATLAMPKPLDRIRFSMAWNRRQETSPLHAWVRKQLMEVLVDANALGSTRRTNYERR